MKIMLLFIIFGLLFVPPTQSWSDQSGPKKADWLEGGSVDEKFTKVSRHLRGFDMAMAEVGYRYVELFWAQKDKNWDYAQYQLDKIRTAIRNGIERRPARKASAEMIFPSLDTLEKALRGKDIKSVGKAFERLTVTCNSCHRAEKVGFMNVQLPLNRLSPIRTGN